MKKPMKKKAMKKTVSVKKGKKTTTLKSKGTDLRKAVSPIITGTADLPPGEYTGSVVEKNGKLTFEVPAEQLAAKYATALTKTGTELVTKDPALSGASALVAQASLLTVDTQEKAIEAGRMLVQLKGWKTQVEQRRQFFTRPLKEHAKRIEALFKPLSEKLDEADATIRTKVLAYRAEAEKKAREEQAKLMEQAQEAQATGDNDSALLLATQATELAAPQKTMLLDEGSMQTKKVWDFEVEDHAAIPREFFSFDEKKVRLAIRSGQREIPGLRIFQKEQLAISGATQVTIDETIVHEMSDAG